MSNTAAKVTLRQASTLKGGDLFCVIGGLDFFRVTSVSRKVDRHGPFVSVEYFNHLAARTRTTAMNASQLVRVKL